MHNDWRNPQADGKRHPCLLGRLFKTRLLRDRRQHQACARRRVCQKPRALFESAFRVLEHHVMLFFVDERREVLLQLENWLSGAAEIIDEVRDIAWQSGTRFVEVLFEIIICTLCFQIIQRSSERSNHVPALRVPRQG